MVLVLMVNPFSGAKRGQKIIDMTKSREDIYIFDLYLYLKSNDELKLQMENSLKNVIIEDTTRIICAGGDGTIKWCVSILDKLGKIPPIGCIPLGTGNELARCSGWNSTWSNKYLQQSIISIKEGSFVDLDRWNV